MKPSATQPITSFTMPAASVSCPKLRRMRPISARILAITGSDEIDSAAAKKSAKTYLALSSPTNEDGMAHPTAKPAAAGTIKRAGGDGGGSPAEAADQLEIGLEPGGDQRGAGAHRASRR